MRRDALTLSVMSSDVSAELYSNGVSQFADVKGLSRDRPWLLPTVSWDEADPSGLELYVQCADTCGIYRIENYGTYKAYPSGT